MLISDNHFEIIKNLFKLIPIFLVGHGTIKNTFIFEEKLLARLLTSSLWQQRTAGFEGFVQNRISPLLSKMPKALKLSHQYLHSNPLQCEIMMTTTPLTIEPKRTQKTTKLFIALMDVSEASL